MLYGYSYAIAAGLMCLAISLASMRWPLRSVANLALYLLLALAVALSAGPAGNLWAIGLCGVVVLAMFERTSAPLEDFRAPGNDDRDRGFGDHAPGSRRIPTSMANSIANRSLRR